MPHYKDGRSVLVGDSVWVKSSLGGLGFTMWNGTVDEVFPDVCACVVSGVHEKPEFVHTSKLIRSE